MAVIQTPPPQATSHLDVETVQTDGGVHGMIHISATSTCDHWVEMSHTQALGYDGDRVLFGQHIAGSPWPESLIGPPAQQPPIREVRIPVDSPRHVKRC